MQPTDHMSTAVEYSCGEKKKHSGNPQQHQTRQSAWHRSAPACLMCEKGCSLMVCWAFAVWLHKSCTLQLQQQLVVFGILQAQCFTDVVV